MQINRAFLPPAFLMLAAMLSLSGCDGAVPRAGERQPSPAPVAPALPALPPRAPVAVARPAPAVARAVPDWRDSPMPAGTWTWIARPGGSTARFGVAGQGAIATLVCERAAGVVRIAMPADPSLLQAAGSRPATITTSTSSGAVTAEPLAIDGLAMTAITLPASHRLLDAMAFSRGRFRVEISGMPAVVLPSWSEVGRVVEDCRG